MIFVSLLQALGRHPHLVQLIDIDEQSPEKIRLVLELCEGGELYDRIQQRQFYPEEDAIQLVMNLLEAVAYINNKGKHLS